MTIYYEGFGVTLHHGDCIEVLRELPDAHVDAVVTDPPYAIGFLEGWDSFGGVQDAGSRGGSGDKGILPGYGRGGTSEDRFSHRQKSAREFQQWCEVWTTECLRVLKPGGHLLAFGAPRMWHRLACAIEDSGLEIRDSIAWLQGQGFPKSLNVAKVTEDEKWQGWGTALRPCHEPIVVARKPLEGSVAQNVLKHGTGGLNIDGTRIATADNLNGGAYAEVGNRSKDGTWNRDSDTGMYAAGKTVGKEFVQPSGRWPSNVVVSHLPECQPIGTKSVSSNGHHPASRGKGGLGTSGHVGQEGLVERAERTEEVTAYACATGCQVSELDAQSGTSKDAVAVRHNGVTGGPTTPFGAKPVGTPDIGYGGSGGASRFFKTVETTLDDLPIRAFYTAKAGTSERPVVGDSRHVTVKPLDLMRWLVRMVTPPGGVVLDPFVGSGTTAEACVLEGFQCIVIEKEEEYLPLTVSRITRQRDPVAHVKLAGGAELTLFDML